MTRVSWLCENDFRARCVAFERNCLFLLLHSVLSDFISMYWASSMHFLFSLFFFFLKYIFEGFTVVARRIPCRMNALSYLLILPLFEARGCFFRFCFLFCSSFFWYSYFFFSKDVLENKSSKNWNFENPIQNVHQGWKWYVLAFLPRNNILFLNFFCLRREVLVFFSLLFAL